VDRFLGGMEFSLMPGVKRTVRRTDESVPRHTEPKRGQKDDQAADYPCGFVIRRLHADDD
jgi:hypothetical protein